MPQQHNELLASSEARIQLAIQAIERDASLSQRRAAAIYNIPQKTLSRRRAGIAFRRDCPPNTMKLTVREEQAIIQHVLDLDSRGFPPRLAAVEDMANSLLAERHRDPVGHNWAPNFVKRQPELKVNTTDNFAARSILFSGIEVKPENGDQKEAELQMSIWMAASLRKKMELVRKAFPTTSVSETDITSDSGVGYNANEPTVEDPIARLPPSPTALLEPALTVIGHEHKVYYACISSAVEDGNIAILGPDEKFTNLSTRSVQGIFKLIKFYAGILDYGYGADRESEHEGKEELWGEYIGRIARAVSAMV